MSDPTKSLQQLDSGSPPNHKLERPSWVIRVGWPMPEKGPLYAHLRKDEQSAAAAALGHKRKSTRLCPEP
jgi:hypothetical protein